MAEEVEIQFDQTIRKWPVFCTVILSIMLFCINFFFYPKLAEIEMKNLCPQSPSEYSTIVDIIRKGSGVETKDGTFYAPGQFWNDSKGIVHVCPCSTEKPCVRKCCATDQVLNRDAKCVKVESSSTNSSFSDALDDMVYKKTEFFNYVDRQPRGKNLFSVLPSCPHFKFVSKKNIVNNRVYLFENGYTWAKYYNAFIHNSRYCLDHIPTISSEKNLELEVFFALCRSTSEEVKWEARLFYNRRTFRHFLQVLCLLFYLATLIVFALQPNIRKGYGRWLMCFQAARFLKVIELLNIFGFSLEHENVCLFTVLVLQYSELASQAWQVIIYYHIWTALRPEHISDLGPVCSYNNKRFMYFSAIAWGIPLIIVAVFTTVTELAIGPDCWYSNRAAKTLYMTPPHVITDLVNLVLCINILRGIKSYKKDSATLPPNNIRHYNAREIQWSGMYVQISIITSANFLLLSVLMMIDRMHHVFDFIYYTMEEIDVMRGIDVFFIFVCHRSQLEVVKDSAARTWHYIMRRIPQLREGRFSPNQALVQ